MDDLQICKRISEIEGVDFGTYESTNQSGKKCELYFYNPLTDDALCFQLMVKYKITVEFTRYYEHIKSITVKAFYDAEGLDTYIRDTNPNKAILLAIIEAHKESIMPTCDQQFENIMTDLKKTKADNEILKSIIKQYELMEKDYEALIELHRGYNESS